MKKIIILGLLLSNISWSHVPVLLLPLKGTPISSYFIGNSEISHAIYSELTKPGDFFIAQFLVKDNLKTHLELLIPVCKNIPQYEIFQPTVFLIKGDLPWKKQGESNQGFIKRLRAKAILIVSSRYSGGNRPKFFEEFGNQYYWVGGVWDGDLWPGLYSMVVFDPKGNKGTFTLGLNEKESWTPDLYKYVGEVLPAISAGLCNPKGFTGKLDF